MSPLSVPTIGPITLIQIQKIARQYGYYLAVCDFSQCHLIAIPWMVDAKEPEILIEALFENLKLLFKGMPTGPELKPHNRLSWTVLIKNNTVLDISVMPPHGIVLEKSPSIRIEV